MATSKWSPRAIGNGLRPSEGGWELVRRCRAKRVKSLRIIATWMSVSQGRDLSLVVLAHAPVARNPPACAFHDESGAAPDFRHGCLEHVPPLPVPTHLSLDTRPPTPVRDRLHQPRSLQRRGTKYFSPASRQRAHAGIVRIGGSDRDRDGNPQRINQEMSFAAFDPLMGIKAAASCRFLNGFHADVASTTAALGSGCLPRRSRSARCNARHKSVQIPYASQAPEVVKNRLPRWKVGWQVAPRAPRSQDVEDRIENGTQGGGWRPASFGLRREMALQTLPLRIRKIAGITRTHPFSLSQRFSPSFQNTVLG